MRGSYATSKDIAQEQGFKICLVGSEDGLGEDSSLEQIVEKAF